MCNTTLVRPFSMDASKLVHNRYALFQTEYPGPCCEKAGYSLEYLKSVPSDEIQLTNGVALEIYQHLKGKNYKDKENGTSLVLRLCGYSKVRMTPKLTNTVRMYLNRLHEKKKGLRRDALDSFLNKEFHHSLRQWSKSKYEVPAPEEPSPPLWPSNCVNTSSAAASTNGFSSEDDSRGGPDQVCCLVDGDQRCQKPAGNASYSKRIQKTVQQRKLNLTRDDSVPHLYICDYHKNMIQRVRTKRKRRESMEEQASPDLDEEEPQIDFHQMPVNTLRRYKREFKIPHRQGLNKSQLAELCANHFKTIPVNEKEITTYFFYMAKHGPDLKSSETGTS